MIIDTNNIKDNEVLSADLCIVGAGPAGITLAIELSHTFKSIIIIESGNKSHSEKAQELLLGEVEVQKHKFNTFPYPLDTSRYRGFAGSTNRWALHGGWRARALDPIDFVERSEIPFSGWPFSADELGPYYKKAADICGIIYPQFSSDSWSEMSFPKDVFIDTKNLQTHFFIRAPNDKFKTYYQEIDKSENINLLLNTTVCELETESNNAQQISNVVFKTANVTGKVKAHNFILASGGIENARLLLNSNKTFPQGIGNESDQVGRYFMDHPHIYTGYIKLKKDAPLATFHLFDHIYHSGQLKLEAMLALSEDELVRHKIANAGIWLNAISVKGLIKQAITDLKSLIKSPKISRFVFFQHLKNFTMNIRLALFQIIKRLIGDKNRFKLFRLYIESEQIPNKDSRVSLNDEKDIYGCNKVKLAWKLTEQDFKTIRKTQEIISQHLTEIGFAEIIEPLGTASPAETIGIGNHHIGTTRMHNDPQKGVVDSDCKVHGMENLFIAGSSVFPTSGAANPTFTVLAMSIRLADHLKQLSHQG